MATDNHAKHASYGNLEAIQGSISALSKTYVDTSLSSSTDPFASKTNKYAETNAIMVQAMDKPVWARFSSDGLTAAQANTDNNFLIEADNFRIFFVDSNSRYVRLIEDAASATSIVTELY